MGVYKCATTGGVQTTEDKQLGVYILIDKKLGVYIDRQVLGVYIYYITNME